MKARLTTPGARSRLRTRLLAHYDREARDLPWRGETDPYRIWVSEVMLQQTRVETVTRYYGPWLRQFPDVESLADASEDRVLKAWEGLGYYRRARSLHRAAAVVRDRHGGVVPSDPTGLLDLPGVGAYTAGAVASIAFGVVTPAVDGNVKRVLSRLYDEPKPTPRWLEERAAELVEPRRPGDWNQALMELGATICVPRAPRCERCPVAELCAARAAGTEKDRPAAARKKPARVLRISVALLYADDRLLLHRRPSDGLLGGMWAFPEGDVDEVAGRVGARLVGDVTALDEVRHRFTHIDATYVPAASRVDSMPTPPDDHRWVALRDVEGLALPVAQQRILGLWTSSRESERA